MANDPSEPPSKRRSSLITEIYFSPISAGPNTVSLSSPLNSPLITPTRESSNSSPSTVEQVSPKPAEDSANSKPSITRVITALIDSELVQKTIKRYLAVPRKVPPPSSHSQGPRAGFVDPDDFKGDSLVVRAPPPSASEPGVPPPPSLTDASSRNAAAPPSLLDVLKSGSWRAPAPPTLIGAVKSGASTTTTDDTSEDHQPRIPDGKLQVLFESMYSKHIDVTAAPQTHLCSVHIIHHRSDGSKGIMTGQDLSPSDDTIRAQLTADIDSITLPDHKCLHRSIFTVSKGDRKGVILRIVVQALRRDIYKRTRVVVIDIDMTQSFTKAAIFELLRTICENDNQYAGTLPIPAREFETCLDILPHLSENRCTMQTLSLLSEIDRITGQFLEFYIVQAKEWHDNGVPARIAVPWVSEGLWTVCNGKEADDMVEAIVEVVGKKSVGGGVFASRVYLDGVKNRVKCVSMVRPGREDKEPREWICFARDGYDIGYW